MESYLLATMPCPSASCFASDTGYLYANGQFDCAKCGTHTRNLQETMDFFTIRRANFQCTVEQISGTITMMLEHQVRNNPAPRDQIRDQLLSVLVLDLNYTGAPPMHGCNPMRHQFAWSLATEGMTGEEIRETVAGIVDRNIGNRDNRNQAKQVQHDTIRRFDDLASSDRVKKESPFVWSR